MNIAVDCRYLGKSGIGRVCEGIIDNLDYSEHYFYLIGNKDKLNKYSNAIIIEDNSNPYSKNGLLKFNKKRINKECQCIIIPNFLIPFGIKIPVHTVMHDLIFLDVKEAVNGKIDYIIKKTLLKRCMKKSKSVACVSKFTKSRCEVHFKKYSQKCYVNYPGLSKSIIEFKDKNENSDKENSIVFVGNVKRHKGLSVLLEAFSKIDNQTVKLKIIGEREGFLTGLKINEKDYPNVIFKGRLDNEELYSEIQKAKFLVQPSVYEGFGLPPLEALYLGTQPIISDIEVFKEIYNDLPVIFFNVSDSDDLAKAIMQNSSLPEDCKDEICNKYSYYKFALNILSHLKI